MNFNHGLSVLNSFSKLNSPSPYTTNPYVYQRNRSFVNCHPLSLLPCQVWITVRSYHYQLVKMYSNSITIVAGVPLVIEVCGYENSMCIIKIFWSYFANTFCMSLHTYIKKRNRKGKIYCNTSTSRLQTKESFSAIKAWKSRYKTNYCVRYSDKFKSPIWISKNIKIF